MKPITILFALMGVIIAVPSFASKTITGTVVDENNEPLINASIIPGTDRTKGTVSRLDGSFEITIDDSVNELNISYIGYETATYANPSGNMGTVTMTPGYSLIDAAIVTADKPCPEDKSKGILDQKRGTDTKCHPTKCIEPHWKLMGPDNNTKCEPVCPTVDNATKYKFRSYDAQKKEITCEVTSCAKNYTPNSDGTGCEQTGGDCTANQLKDVTHAKTGHLIKGTCYPTTCTDNWTLVGRGTNAKCQAPCPTIEHAKKTTFASYSNGQYATCTVDKCENGWMPNDDRTKCEPTEGACTNAQLKAIKNATAGEQKKGKCYATECSDGYEPNNQGVCVSSSELDELKEKAKAARDKEQSFANKALGAAGIVSVGVGGMKLAQGLAEQKADAKAEEDMRAYLETVRCGYDGGQQYTAGRTEIALPRSSELAELKQQYNKLATNLKGTKESLDMPPGIEAEVVLEKAQMGLYDDEYLGNTGGPNASIARAILNPGSDDADKLQAQADETKSLITKGAVIGGVGAIATASASAIANKNAPKDKSAKIKSEYDTHAKKLESNVQDAESRLNTALENNRKKVTEYNTELAAHSAFIASTENTTCTAEMTDYVNYINGLSPIQNEMQSTENMTISYDLSSQKQIYDTCVSNLEERRLQCVSAPGKEWINNECRDKPKPVVVEHETTPEDSTPSSENITAEDVVDANDQPEAQTEIPVADPETKTKPDPDQCPAVNPRMPSLTEKNRVGDSCTYGKVTKGVVFKRREDNTCSCKALECEPGYKADKGMCVEDTSASDAIAACTNKQFSESEFRGGKSSQPNSQSKIPTLNKPANILCNEFCTNWAQSATCTNTKTHKYDAKAKTCTCNAPESSSGNSGPATYYNCGEKGFSAPNGVICEFVTKFNRATVTPQQANGLMLEYARKKHNDEINCATTSQRANKQQTRYRQCHSKTKKSKFYEFEFQSLSSGDDGELFTGNGGFTSALCSIWDLDNTGNKGCKNASTAQCNAISNAINRTFYIGGSATLDGTTCVIKAHETAESKKFAIMNQTTTKSELNTIDGISPTKFIGNEFKNNAGSAVYSAIYAYMFKDLRLPVKTFTCSSSFIDNINFFDGTQAQYDQMLRERQECIDKETAESPGDPDVSGCISKYTPQTTSADLLTCQYGDRLVDFLFKKLDVRWSLRANAGAAALSCVAEGGDFTGKSCTLADETTCDKFNAQLKKDYPNSKGMKWNGEACISEDASQMQALEKTAKVIGMVSLTLVTAGTGGPIVVGLAVAESAALVYEAASDTAISDWAESFIADAAKCTGDTNSACANSVLKKHIARIQKGSYKFTDTQQRKISEHMERLMGMLDEKTLDGVTTKIDENATNPDFAAAMCDYYGTELTTQEKALVVSNKVATVLTFATLIGSGVLAGLRVAALRNWIKLSPATQAKWLKWKILKSDDIAKLGVDSSGQTTTTITRSQAKKLDDLAAQEKRIQEARQQSGLGAKEAEELNTDLKRVQQEQRTLKNQLGMTDTELNTAKEAAYNKAEIEAAQQELAKLEERQKHLYTTNKNGEQILAPGTTKYDAREVENAISAQKKKIADLGGEVADATTDGARTTGNSANTATRTRTGAAAKKDAEINIPAGKFDDAGDVARGTEQVTNKNADISTTASTRTRAPGAKSGTSATTKVAANPVAHYESDLTRMQKEFDNGVQSLLADTTGMTEEQIGAYNKWLQSKGYHTELTVRNLGQGDETLLHVRSNKPASATTNTGARGANNGAKSGTSATTKVAANPVAHYESDLAKMQKQFDNGAQSLLADTTGMTEEQIGAYNKWLQSKGYRTELTVRNLGQGDETLLHVRTNKPQTVNTSTPKATGTPTRTSGAKSENTTSGARAVANTTQKLNTEKNFNAIRRQYPNLSDDTINAIVSNPNASPDDIYNMLRRVRPGKEYAATENTFNNAIDYLYKNSSNFGNDVFNDFFGKYVSDADKLIKPDKSSKLALSSYQDWTWRRSATRTKAAIKDPVNTNGYHISLNVDVNENVLKKLDAILVKDGGQHINYYKVPKKGYFDEVVTRHDPITIYMYSRNTSLEKEIANAVQPYVRSSDGLVGELIAPGVDINVEVVNGIMSVGQREANKIWGLLHE